MPKSLTELSNTTSLLVVPLATVVCIVTAQTVPFRGSQASAVITVSNSGMGLSPGPQALLVSALALGTISLQPLQLDSNNNFPGAATACPDITDPYNTPDAYQTANSAPGCDSDTTTFCVAKDAAGHVTGATDCCMKVSN